jgi:hypothetical protein
VLDPHYNGLGLVIQFVGKERALQITNEYGCQVLLPLLISAYNFLNPSDASIGASSFTCCSAKPTSICDLWEINEEMTLLTVKEQLNHFRLRKVPRRRPKIH